MNYHELQYILCIAKHQNLTKAAQECKFCSNGTPILKSAVHSF